MNRIHLILVASLLCSPSLFSQSRDDDWLSLSRLSVSISSSYHYRPWTKLNEAYSKVQEHINYSNSYVNPSGYSEHILGDIDVSGMLQYRLFDGLSFGVVVGKMSTGSIMSLLYSVRSTLYANGEIYVNPATKNRLELHLDTWKYGVGLEYSSLLSETIQATVGISYQRVEGELKHVYRVEQDYGIFTYESTLKETRGSWTAKAGISIPLYGPLSLLSAIEYRWLRFPNLKGSGVYRDRPFYFSLDYERVVYFDAYLMEADSYFGIGLDEQSGFYADESRLYSLASATGARSWWQTGKPAILDLTGFGARIGLQVDF